MLRHLRLSNLTFAISKSGVLDCNKILQEIYNKVKATASDGRVSDYIPELAQVDPGKFGIALITVKGEKYAVGDVDETFSIQSISKVFLLAMAFTTNRASLPSRWDCPGKVAWVAHWQPSTPIITAQLPGARGSTKRVTRFTECAPWRCLPPSPKTRSFKVHSSFEADKC